MCVSVCNGVCSCNYTAWESDLGAQSSSYQKACRVMLNAYSGVLDACTNTNW